MENQKQSHIKGVPLAVFAIIAAIITPIIVIMIVLHMFLVEQISNIGQLIIAQPKVPEVIEIVEPEATASAQPTEEPSPSVAPRRVTPATNSEESR